MSSPYGPPPEGAGPNDRPTAQPGPNQPQYGPPPGQYGGHYPAPAPQYAGQYGAPAPYAGGPGGRPLPPLASWGQRVGAYLIDQLMVLPGLLLTIPGIAQLATHSHGVSMVGLCLLIGGVLLAFGLHVWNRWLRQEGSQSIGKKVMGLRLLNEATMTRPGAFGAFARDVCHMADSIACDIGYLWPLWDDKRQTFADKIMSTVVVDEGKH